MIWEDTIGSGMIKSTVVRIQDSDPAEFFYSFIQRIKKGSPEFQVNTCKSLEGGDF